MANKFFWLGASFVLMLSSCGGSDPKGPELKINDERTGLIWEKAEGDSGYEIDVDGVKDLIVSPSYAFSSVVGEHKIIVTPVDASGNRGASSSFEYETKQSALGELSLESGKITWSSAATCGLEYKVDNGEYKPVVGEYIEADEEGLYTVVAPMKMNEQKVFYNKKVEKYILVTSDSEEEYVLEDATAPDDASLSELYTKTKYTNNGWVSSTSDVSLDKTWGAYITGNAASFKFWRQDVYFKFSKEVSIPGSFNELSFSIKSEEAVDAYLAFEVAHTLVVGNMDLNGVYITYPIPTVPTKWTHYRVTLDDPSWVITFNGMKASFSQIRDIVKGYGFYINKLSDFLPFFDTFQLRIRGVHDENWSTCRAQLDDVKLVNSELKTTEITEIVPRISLSETYAFKSDSVSAGNLIFDGDNGTFNIPSLLMSIPVSCAIVDNKAVVTSNESDKDFVAIFSSPDGGATLKLDSVTGTLAPYFTNIVVEAINKLDDYESYNETGVGFDKFHQDESERSGLRGAYYCDYYSTNGPQSVIADSNWSLMGSTDYLKLNSEDAHTGTKSMSLKAGSNACRFMNYEMRTGDGVGYKGKYLSMWMKNVISANATLVIAAYSTNKLDASNHVSDAIRTVMTITAKASDTEWHEVKLALDPNKTYYGFSVVTKDGPGTAGRVLVDDVYIFGDLSPWGN